MDKNSNRASMHFFSMLDFIDLQISRLEGFILAIGIILMAVNTVAGVVSRYVFNDALIFTDELNRLFIVMVTFAGISYAARLGRHIRMSAFYDVLPQIFKKILMILMCILTAYVMFSLSYFSILYILDIHHTGRILPSLGIPAYIIYLWVPIGFFVTGIQYALTVIKNFRYKEVYLSTDVLDGYCDIDPTSVI
ncbi:MAG: TRAP transporter small permease [Sulfurospirillaceae bacterium]|nr:TRAP transporter small permease [Sulfurospirillaceae bacterium]